MTETPAMRQIGSPPHPSPSELGRLLADLLEGGLPAPVARGIERHISAASTHSPPAVIQAMK